MSRKRSKARKEKNELKKQSKMRRNLIAIYDGFRKGGPYNNYFNMADSELLGEFFTEPIFEFHRLSDTECGAALNGTTSLRLEVYRVSDALIERLNKNYGYSGIKNDENIFDKISFNSPYGKLSIWIYKKFYASTDIIYEGDWIEYCNNLKLQKEKKKEKEIAKSNIEVLDEIKDTMSSGEKEFSYRKHREQQMEELSKIFD